MTSALIERLLAFPDRVAGVVAGCDPAHWCERVADGGFSLLEHLCHLRDIEREGYAPRIRRILAEEMPELAEIDGSALALARDYQRQDLRAALRDWQAARATTVALLRENLPLHADRKGIFGGFGVVTLQSLAEGIAAHDAMHWDEFVGWAVAHRSSI